MAALVVILASFFMPRNDDQEFIMLVSMAIQTALAIFQCAPSSVTG